MKPHAAKRRPPFFFVLLATLVGIWGLVLYRFGRGLRPPPSPSTSIPAVARAAAEATPPGAPAAPSFVADGSDPFELPAALFPQVPGEEAPVDDPPPPPPFTLNGIVGTTVLLSGRDAVMHIVQEGDTVGGLHLRAVHPDHVVADFEGRRLTLHLAL